MAQASSNYFHYVAFLRGVNIGGHAAIRMIDLKAAFERMGFDGVKTVLASGNVVFATPQADEKELRAEIESGLRKVFKRDIYVLLRNRNDLIKLRSSEPFKGIGALPEVQLYVTFLSEGAKTPTVKIPYATLRNELRIIGATATEVFSVVHLGKGMGTPELMAILEKEFGSGLTTRNWNTVLKLLA
jgi:uncharacterized protein (DUF1697 family)